IKRGAGLILKVGKVCFLTGTGQVILQYMLCRCHFRWIPLGGWMDQKPSDREDGKQANGNKPFSPILPQSTPPPLEPFFVLYTYFGDTAEIPAHRFFHSTGIDGTTPGICFWGNRVCPRFATFFDNRGSLQKATIVYDSSLPSLDKRKPDEEQHFHALRFRWLFATPHRLFPIALFSYRRFP